MGRKKLERQNCVDCGIKLKRLGTQRCKSCAGKHNVNQRLIIPFRVRFLQKVKIPNDPYDCWEWTGAIDPQTGYGRIGLGKRSDGVSNAHRESYLLHYGFIGDGMLICHKCNNAECVNPLHLYEGTYSDNLKQAWNDNLR